MHDHMQFRDLIHHINSRKMLWGNFKKPNPSQKPMVSRIHIKKKIIDFSYFE